jgi:hypothetical protein
LDIWPRHRCRPEGPWVSSNLCLCHAGISKYTKAGLEGKCRQKASNKSCSIILGRFADLAYQLGFHSDEITALRRYHAWAAAPEDYLPSRPSLNRAGPDLPKAERCGIPRSSAYEEVRDFLFLDHLHEKRRRDGVTPFFVRQSVYFAFFGRLTTPSSNGDSHREESGFPSYGFRRPA